MDIAGYSTVDSARVNFNAMMRKIKKLCPEDGTEPAAKTPKTPKAPKTPRKRSAAKSGDVEVSPTKKTKVQEENDAVDSEVRCFVQHICAKCKVLQLC